MIEHLLTNVERVLLGNTWAMERMSFWARARFGRDTGLWPGIHGEEVTRMFIQSDIEGELADGKLYCARRKLARAKEAGLISDDEIVESDPRSGRIEIVDF